MSDAERALLLREAARAAETHEWERGYLMHDSAGRLVYFAGNSLFAREVGPPFGHPGAKIDCDEVTSCCTLGYLYFAAVCLLPLMNDNGKETLDARAFQAAGALAERLWEREDVRAAAVAWWKDSREDDGEYDTFDEFLAEEGLDAIGEEGLVPFWNDTIAKEKGDVIALLNETATMIEGSEA